MPFQSQAQRRKFYAMAESGEIPHSTVKKWEDATPKGKKLPERIHKKAFWLGFGKAAEQGPGKGFTGAGKGSVSRSGDLDDRSGPISQAPGSGDDLITDKPFLSRDRNPRSFDPFKLEGEIDEYDYSGQNP